MKTLNKILQITALLILPIFLFVCTWAGFESSILLIFACVIISMLPFFMKFERQKPRPRDILPVVVLASIAAVGRIIFYSLPNIKPMAAIVIIAGVCLGEESGFLTGALAALASNIFFGQGPWTPFQMYSLAVIGFFAGILAKHNIFRHSIVLYIYGFVSVLFYGFIVDSWIVFDLVVPLTWKGALTIYSTGLPFTLIHATSTVIFLIPIHTLWTNSIKRIIKKYDIK